MRQVFSTTRGIRVLEVPAPLVRPGNILVEVAYSFVSSGTELATLEAMEARGKSLTKEITDKPDMVAKIVRHLREGGVRKTVSVVQRFLDQRDLTRAKLAPIGYSCSGTVVSVGEGVTHFQTGDRVVCAGAGKATHSELVVAPVNLALGIPEGTPAREASSAAIGAVAMQGVRRADIRLGESVAVLGLGLMGLITIQLLRASGARVICFDPNPLRVGQAKELGFEAAFYTLEAFQQEVHRLSDHMGVDACLITASSKSNGIVQNAMEITRQKGKVVVVGLVGMHIQKSPFLRKEIDFLVSSSYGPGRYDDRYEEKGMDYPYAYVRWTENRNMVAYLRLLADKQVVLDPFAGKTFPLESADEAYALLKDPGARPVAFFIRHPSEKPFSEKNVHRVVCQSAAPDKRRIGIAVVGAGKFVSRVHLPSLKRLRDSVRLRAVMTPTGARALELARQFGGESAATSFRELLEDASIQAVLIGVRHHLHAEMTLAALKAGKHVFVEKPLAMNDEELKRIEAFYEEVHDTEARPLLMTGFNRRFSPFATHLKARLVGRLRPLVITYEMNAGFLPADHWLRTDEGGGRNIGEACHIYDLFTFLTESRVCSIRATHLRPPDNVHGKNENFTATLSFEDGSIASLTYTSLGCREQPKETMRVFCDERIFVLNDYKQLDAYGGSEAPFSTDVMEKGHFEEMQCFINAIQEQGDWPIPFWQQVQATRIANTVEQYVTNTSHHGNVEQG